jgi:Zinc finger, C2H2 type
MANFNVPKSTGFFTCEKCDFISSRLSHYKRHIMTSKHIMANNLLINTNNLATKSTEDLYKCKNCKKTYKHQSSLCKHKKTCKQEDKIDDHNASLLDKDDLIIQLLKQNKELIDVVKNGTNNNYTVTQTNSNNKSFNLNFFLNETCKNAMNIMDFVDSIKLQLSDLENIGEVGYVEGISKIILKNLKKLDITERPVHCTDSKRETLYVKDDNKWEKENEERAKIKKAIKRVANKNISLIQEFKAKYPDCIYSESKRSDQYNKMIVEAFELGDPEKQEKIIKKIAKEVIIDKESALQI